MKVCRLRCPLARPPPCTSAPTDAGQGCSQQVTSDGDRVARTLGRPRDHNTAPTERLHEESPARNVLPQPPRPVVLLPLSMSTGRQLFLSQSPLPLPPFPHSHGRTERRCLPCLTERQGTGNDAKATMQGRWMPSHERPGPLRACRCEAHAIRVGSSIGRGGGASGPGGARRQLGY